MISKPLLRIIVSIVILCLFGCSPKTTIQMTRPAEVDVGGINRIAIMDFRGGGNSGASAASVFTSKLFETGFYTIVERTELQKILEEHALTMSGVVDVELAVQAGNVLGVQGVIVGDVIAYRCDDRRGKEKVKQQVWTGEYQKDKDGNYIYEKTLFGRRKKKVYREEFVDVEVIDREANVALSFRLIDVETARIIATRQASHSYSKRVRSGEKPLPPKNEILTNLGIRCVNEFVRVLAPYKVSIQTQFAKGNGDVNKGIEFAKNELWDKAEEIWQAEVEKDSKNHAAWYNLGLAFEVQGDYLQAQDAYDKALSLKSTKLYISGLKRIRERIEDYRRLQQQLRQQNQVQPQEDL
jgi:hypothetical protein